jgi:hypothetical protein
MANIPSRIRFDDAVTPSSDPKITGKELEKFAKNVNWCSQIYRSVPLTPAILCQDIEKIPGAVEYIRNTTQEGIIFPDLHGWDHGPYAPRSQDEIEDHLDKAMGWFHDSLGVLPIRWVTPHGADSHAIQAAATKFNLVVETTDNPVIDQKTLDPMLRKTRDLSTMDGRVVMNHWWERGLRLYRIAKIIEHQDVDAAIEATRSDLSKKDHGICWNGWE